MSFIRNLKPNKLVFFIIQILLSFFILYHTALYADIMYIENLNGEKTTVTIRSGRAYIWLYTRNDEGKKIYLYALIMDRTSNSSSSSTVPDRTPIRPLLIPPGLGVTILYNESTEISTSSELDYRRYRLPLNNYISPAPYETISDDNLLTAAQFLRVHGIYRLMALSTPEHQDHPFHNLANRLLPEITRTDLIPPRATFTSESTETPPLEIPQEFFDSILTPSSDTHPSSTNLTTHTTTSEHNDTGPLTTTEEPKKTIFGQLTDRVSRGFSLLQTFLSTEDDEPIATVTPTTLTDDDLHLSSDELTHSPLPTSPSPPDDSLPLSPTHESVYSRLTHIRTILPDESWELSTPYEQTRLWPNISQSIRTTAYYWKHLSGNHEHVIHRDINVRDSHQPHLFVNVQVYIQYLDSGASLEVANLHLPLNEERLTIPEIPGTFLNITVIDDTQPALEPGTHSLSDEKYYTSNYNCKTLIENIQCLREMAEASHTPHQHLYREIIETILRERRTLYYQAFPEEMLQEREEEISTKNDTEVTSGITSRLRDTTLEIDLRGFTTDIQRMLGPLYGFTTTRNLFGKKY